MQTVVDLPDFHTLCALPSERADAAANRQAILDCARKMLASTTIQNISMTDLAVNAGVGKGTLYRRFENKTDLAKALVTEDMMVLQDKLTAHNDLSETPRELLEWFVKSLTEFIVTNGNLVSAIIMKSDRHANWWYDTPHVRWISINLEKMFVAATGANTGADFAKTLIPVIFFLGPLDSPDDVSTAHNLVENLVKTLLDPYSQTQL